MSSKNTNEKVLEIDAHVSKHYDIVRRLGKGVIFFFILLFSTNRYISSQSKLFQFVKQFWNFLFQHYFFHFFRSTSMKHSILKSVEKIIWKDYSSIHRTFREKKRKKRKIIFHIIQRIVSGINKRDICIGLSITVVVVRPSRKSITGSNR